MAYYSFDGAFANLNSGIDELGKQIREQRNTDAQLAAFDAWDRQRQTPLGQATQAAPVSLKSLGQGDYFGRTASAESSGNDTAKNPNSSATGRYQFLQGTWNGLMRSNPELGLTADGRTDPEQSNRAMRAFTAQNADALKTKGIDPSDRNLYMAHFLGAGAAPNFINAVQQDPSVPAASLVRPEVVAANKGVFLNQDGTPRSAGEVYARMTDRFGNGSTGVAALSGGQGAPVQVAQAQPTSQADLPAPGAAQAQGFAVPGGPQPATRDNINPQMIRGLLANPGTRDIGKALWQQVLSGKGYDFQVVGDQLYRVNKNAGTVEPVGISKPVQPVTVSPGQRLVDPRTGQVVYQGANDSFRNLVTPEERAAAGIQADDKRPYQMGPDGKLSSPGGTTVNNNIDAKGEGEYAKANGKAISERFAKMVEEGDAAEQEAGTLARLRELGGQIKNIGQGAALQGWLAERGIKVGPNVSEIEAYGALIDKLTPQQRVPGSGATSDYEGRMFKNALPGLMRTPQGNELIQSTLEALNLHKRQRADLVAEAMANNEKPSEVVKKLKALPDPFAAFRKAREGGLSNLPETQQEGRAPETPRQPELPSIPNARQAPDGKFYVPDPNRPGKYLQVQ